MDIMTSSAGKAGGTSNDQSTKGQVHHIFGSIEKLFGALYLEHQNEQARQLSVFMEKYHHGPKEKDGGVFQLVLLNFPSGLEVYGLKKMCKVPSKRMKRFLRGI